MATTYYCLRCGTVLGDYEYISDVPEVCPNCADIPDEDLPEPGYVCIRCRSPLWNRYSVCDCIKEDDDQG